MLYVDDGEDDVDDDNNGGEIHIYIYIYINAGRRRHSNIKSKHIVVFILVTIVISDIILLVYINMGCIWGLGEGREPPSDTTNVHKKYTKTTELHTIYISPLTRMYVCMYYIHGVAETLNTQAKTYNNYYYHYQHGTQYAAGGTHSAIVVAVVVVVIVRAKQFVAVRNGT